MVVLAAAPGMAAASNYYEVPFYAYNGTASTQNIYSASLNTNFDCAFNLFLRQTLLKSSSYTSTDTIYSPDGIVNASTTFSASGYTNCAAIASVNGLKTESKIQIVHTATSGNATIKNAWECSSASRYIEITPPAVNKNSYGNQYNAYAFRDTSFLSNASIISKITNTWNCYTPLSPSPVLNESGTVGITAQYIVNYVYLPINSTGGEVYYFISGEPQNAQKSTAYITSYAINGFYARGELWLYDVEANSISSLYTEQNNCNIGQTCRINTNLTGTLNLGADKLYYLIYDAGIYIPAGGGAVPYMVTQPMNYNVTIDAYHADYVCESSECVDGYKQVICRDNNGIAADKISLEACFTKPTVDVDLGFEDYYAANAGVCEIAWAVSACPYALIQKSVKYPLGWVSSSGAFDAPFIAYYRNFIEMSSETSTAGTMSLKMWSVPPKSGEPVNYPATCGNLSSGAFPEVTHSYNETMFAEYNVSFASPYAQFRYDIKKCSKPVIQYDYESNLALTAACGASYIFGGWFFPNNFAPMKQCYGNCSKEPDGVYGIRIMDSTTSQIIAEINGNAALEWSKDNVLDLSNAGLTVGKNYTIGMAVNPLNPLALDSSCVYFDNVRATFTDAQLPDCVSKCDAPDNPLNYLRATALGNNCLFSTEVNSPLCAESDKQREQIEKHEPFCVNLTLNTYNNVTNEWEFTLNSEYCVQLLAEETAQNAQNTGFVVIPADSPLAPINNLLSLTFIAFIINIVIGGLVAYSTKNAPLALVATIGTALVFSFIGLYPIVIAVVIVILTAALAAYELRKPVVGG
jgi:hypothetical protein